MDTTGFAELFAELTREPLTDQQLASLREWLATLSSRVDCLALIERAAGRCPCPHCGCPRNHRCGHAKIITGPVPITPVIENLP